MSDEPLFDDDEYSAFALAARRRDGIVHHRDDSAKAKELEDLGVRVVRGRGEASEPAWWLSMGSNTPTTT
jgi:predicted AAA+ superfamily ATPase